MYSEFFILVVFVALGQGALVQDANVHGLSEKDAEVYYEIMNMQSATYAAKFQMFDCVFNVLNKLAFDYWYGLTSKDEDTSSLVTEALARANDATNYIVQAVLLALDTDCSNLPVQHTPDLENIFTYIADAIELAKLGNYEDNAAGIEQNRDLVLAAFDHLVQALYDSIRTCLNTSDDNSLAATQTAQTESAKGLHYTTNAVFNTIKQLADVISNKTRGRTLFTSIEEKWENALIGLRIDIQSEFSLIVAMFVKTQLDIDEALPELLSLQYSQLVAASRYQIAAATIFDSITDELTRIRLGLPDDGEDDFSVLDAAQAKTAAKFRSGVNVLVESVKKIKPELSEAAEEIRLELLTSANTVSDVLFTSVRVARDKDTTKNDAEETLKQIRSNAIAKIPSFVDRIVQLGTLGCNVKSLTVETIRRRLVDLVTDFEDSIYDAIDVLLTATHDTGDANIVDSISTVETYQADANYRINIFTLLIETLRIKGLQSDRSK